jgi:hypothetical protein
MIDNLPAHKAVGVREAIEARGATFDISQIFARPEPAFQQAQGRSAQGCRADNSAPAPPDRPLRSDPLSPPAKLPIISGTQATREIHVAVDTVITVNRHF